MPTCVCCGKVTSFNSNAGYWRSWECSRQWVCTACYESRKYAESPHNTFDRRDLCWRHGLPMRDAGGCIQCEKEGY